MAAKMKKIMGDMGMMHQGEGSDEEEDEDSAPVRNKIAPQVEEMAEEENDVEVAPEDESITSEETDLDEAFGDL